MSSLKSDLQVAPQEIFGASTTQGTDLGARMTDGGGRVFRYAFGTAAAFVAGKIYQAYPQDSTNWQNLSILASATLATTVTTSTTLTVTANQLAGGLLTVRSTPGQGFAYGIKSHPAASAGTVTFTLSDPIQIALSSSSVIDVTPNLYNGVVVAPATLPTGAPVGVAPANTAGTQWGWLQTQGLANVLSDGAITVGTPVTLSGSVAGAVKAATSATQVVVGYAAITTTDQKYAPIVLQL